MLLRLDGKFKVSFGTSKRYPKLYSCTETTGRVIRVNHKTIDVKIDAISFFIDPRTVSIAKMLVNKIAYEKTLSPDHHEIRVILNQNRSFMGI